MKWFEYALALAACVLLACAQPLAASSIADAPTSYSLSVVSSSDLEAQLNYSFTQLTENSWRVDWEWKSEAHRQELIAYREGKGKLPRWIEKDSADAANHVEITEFGYLSADTDFIDETQANEKFVLTLDVEGKRGGKGKGDDDKVKVGLHSVVIAITTFNKATGESQARHLEYNTTCNVLHAVAINNASAYYYQSFDHGLTWLNASNVSNGYGQAHDANIAQYANGDIAIVYSELDFVYYVKGTKNAYCGWSFSTPLLVVDQDEYNPASYTGRIGFNLDSNDVAWLAYTGSYGTELAVKVCRSSCGTASNWNSTNNTYFATNMSALSYSITNPEIAFVGSDAYILLVNMNNVKTNLFRFAYQSAGVWEVVSDVGFDMFNVGLQGIPSFAVNSSGAMFQAFASGTNPALSYCTSGCNDSLANWRGYGSAAGSNYSVFSNFVDYGVSVSIVNDYPVLFWADNGQIMYAEATDASGFHAPVNLTNGAFTNSYYPSTLRLNAKGVLFTNGSSPYTVEFLNFTVLPTLALSVYSPSNTSYVSYPYGVYSFESNTYSTANCSTFVDGVLFSSVLASNAVNESVYLNSLTLGAHSFNVYCFNDTDYSSQITYFSFDNRVFLNVSCFDEVTGNDIVCDSVIVSNSTNSTMQANAHSFSFDYPTGSISVVASNASFYSRTYATYFLTSNVSINAYLLNASATAIFVRFHVSNAFSQPVNNASITLQRFINGSNVVVSSLVTDSFGLASDYLELAHPYQVLVYAAEYNVYVSTISPVVNDYYISLVSVTNFTIPGFGSYELNNTFGDAYWNLEPNTHSLSNETTNIVFSVFSPGATLHYFGMQVDYANGTNVCFQNVTNSSAGGVVSCLVHMDNTTYGTNVSVTVWIARSPPWVSDFIFWFKQTASTSVNTLSDFYQGMRTTAGNADSTAMAFIVIVVATIAGLWVYQYHKTGAMLVMLAILWLGAVEQFLNVNLLGFNVNGVYLMAFITVAIVSINFLKERV